MSINFDTTFRDLIVENFIPIQTTGHVIPLPCSSTPIGNSPPYTIRGAGGMGRAAGIAGPIYSPWRGKALFSVCRALQIARRRVPSGREKACG